MCDWGGWKLCCVLLEAALPSTRMGIKRSLSGAFAADDDVAVGADAGTLSLGGESLSIIIGIIRSLGLCFGCCDCCT